MSKSLPSPELLALAERLASLQSLTTSVAGTNTQMAVFLASVGLPTEGVLTPFADRAQVLNAFQAAVEVLPAERRATAFYLSKYVVAVTVGLFDAALNYLWNETVTALRGQVARTDLQFFFDAVEKRADVRARLQTAEHLPEIGEAALIDGSHRIGLLNSVNHERLRHINFMRNHASAAHPNQNDLTGGELIGWLSNCLKFVIVAEPAQDVVTIHRLLIQLRTASIKASDAPVIVGGIVRLPQPRIDDFLWTIFGIYSDTRQTPKARANIELVAKATWDASSESRRYEVGARYAEFAKNAEEDKKTLVNQFLTQVSGLAYRSEEVLVPELLDKLRSLWAAHIGWNNFTNERSHARALSDSLPVNGHVPEAVKHEWVKVICACYFGNGLGYREGVDEGAEPYYQSHIDTFAETEIIEFLELFSDNEFSGYLCEAKPDQRARVVAKRLYERTRQVHMRFALDQIIKAPAKSLQTISGVTAYRQAIAGIRH